MLRRNLLYSGTMQRRSIRSKQLGLGAFGMLVVLALAAVAGYYLYTSLSGGGDNASCRTQFESCMQACRRSQTDNSDMQACQKKCEDDQAFCEVAAKRNR